MRKYIKPDMVVSLAIFYFYIGMLIFFSNPLLPTELDINNLFVRIAFLIMAIIGLSVSAKCVIDDYDHMLNYNELYENNI